MLKQKQEDLYDIELSQRLLNFFVWKRQVGDEAGPWLNNWFVLNFRLIGVDKELHLLS